MPYSSYDHDKLEAAETMRIERRIYFEAKDREIAPYASLPIAQLLSMRSESAAAEQAIFDDLKERAAAWEEQAGRTLLLDKTLEYVRTPHVQHTANEWQTTEHNRHIRSNRVYQMNYYIYENTRYDKEAQKSIPYSWTLTWSVRTNSPSRTQAKIAGQDRKVFTDKAAMEKYLNGRIKAYDRLFTEISPPIPQEYADYFKVNGMLMGAMILAEIGDFSRFDSPDKILAYAGMSPSTYQSGQLSLSGAYSHMEKRGSRYLRYALYNATKYVCLWDPTFAAYLAKKRAEGKHYNVALSHATKKLVRLIYALEKSKRPYSSAA